MPRLTTVAAICASVAVAVGTSACGGSTTSSGTTTGDFDTGGCTPLIAAVSPEKVNLFTKLSEAFQDSPEAKGLSQCAKIVPVDVASGEATRLLKLGWPETETDKPRPVIWSPASSAWVAQVADSKGRALVPSPRSFARTPVVFAMPEAMARTLGWPSKAIGFTKLRELCLDPKGWGRFGGAAALWGPFRIGKTNPNTSTTGLNVLLMQNFAAAGKRRALTVADVTKGTPFSRDFESCVIHYGDTTGNVLNRMYTRDLNGQSLNYVSAVAVEETSLINYNLGNPTSRVVKEGERLTPPKRRLVAIYPTEGSLQSDNPVVVLGPPATWVTEEQRAAAQAFAEFVVTSTAQEFVDDFGFRPIDPRAPVGGLVSAEYGANPDLPAIRLQPPSVPVVSAALRQWEQVRKPSSVLELIDVSKSMEEPAGGGLSRIEAAIVSAKDTLGHFRPTDELGVWAFTTEVRSDAGKNVVELRPVVPLGGGREGLASEIDKLTPQAGTPLYDAISTAFKYMRQRAQPGRINAIIVLSDGEDQDSVLTLDDLKRELRGPTESNDPAPVRVFPIIYGQDAPPAALQEIAEASGGQVFNASDPRRIKLVFRSVVNNF